VAFENHFSGLWPLKAGQRVEQRCLSSPGHAAKEERFSAMNLQADASKDIDRSRSNLKGAMDIFRGELWLVIHNGNEAGEHLRTTRSLLRSQG